MDIRIVVEKKDARGDWKAEYFDVVNSEMSSVLGGIKEVVKNLNSPISKQTEHAAKAIEIYNTIYKERLEATHMNQFAVINVGNSQVFVGANEKEAIDFAKEINPDGTFHLIRIGHETAYHV